MNKLRAIRLIRPGEPPGVELKRVSKASREAVFNSVGTIEASVTGLGSAVSSSTYPTKRRMREAVDAMRFAAIEISPMRS